VRSLDANEIAKPYRCVSVHETTVPLEPGPLREYLVGRPKYRRTQFIVMGRGAEWAMVQVSGKDTRLFEPIEDAALVASPGETVFIRDPSVDTANASAMARCALRSGQAARLYLIEGLYGHVNFIYDPAPIPVRVIEVVPPRPPKLSEMARRVIEYDEDLPPVELLVEEIDLVALARRTPAETYMFPCRSSGIELGAPVTFLDQGPDQARDWRLVGCRRSLEIHESLYGAPPRAFTDMCPRVQEVAPGPALLKCCRHERGIEHEDQRVIVPWGATLEEVRAALHQLVDSAQPAQPTASAA